MAAASAADSAVPPIAQQASIVVTFTNSTGDPVHYRRGWHEGGSTGFGREKVHRKHGITNDHVIEKVVSEPQEVLQDNPLGFPGRWIHRKEALLLDLFGGVTDRVTVRVVIDYHGWSGPGQLGIVTAYCEGHRGLCPSWINRAF